MRNFRTPSDITDLPVVVYLAVYIICYISMNLTRQLKLLKVAHNFFRFGRGLSLTVQRNRFSPAVHKEQKAVDSDPDLSDLSVLGPVRHFLSFFIVF